MLTSDAPGPTFYEPGEAGQDYPCECERADLDRELFRRVRGWMADYDLRWDWRVDFDLMETVHDITAAVEYRLCRDCARQVKADEQAEGDR